MTTTTLDWALWAGAGVLGLIALGVLLWALFWDRSRGRRRCPRCWYGMDALAAAGAMTCPECGHVAPTERALRRTRRRWRWVIVALLVGIVAYGVGETPRVRKRGWATLIPSSVLVTVWPVSVKDWVSHNLDGRMVRSAPLAELDARRDRDGLAGWKIEWWRDRVETYLRANGRLGISGVAGILQDMSRTRVTRDIVAERVEDVVAALSTDTGLQIGVDWDAVKEFGIDKNTRVSLIAEGTPAGQVLTRLVVAMGNNSVWDLTWWPTPDGATIGTRAQDPTATTVCRYDAKTPGVDARRLASLMSSLVEPEGWFENGGDHLSGVVLGTHVLVRGPARSHLEIIALLSALERSFTGEVGAATSVDEPAWEASAAALSALERTPITLEDGFTSLGSLLDGVGAQGGVRMKPDWANLSRTNLREDSPISTHAVTLNAAQALTKVLEGARADVLLGVAWTIDNGVVTVTSRDKLSSHRLVRVYDVPDLLAPEGRPTDRGIRDLTAVIAANVDPGSWVEAGGDVGVMIPMGSRLVIQTTFVNHIAIEGLLSKLREAARRNRADNAADGAGP